MANLNQLLQTLSDVNRLNTIEASCEGLAGSKSNFIGTWQGFDSAGNGIINVNGVRYNGSVASTTGIALNSKVIVRTGRNFKVITW